MNGIPIILIIVAAISFFMFFYSDFKPAPSVNGTVPSECQELPEDQVASIASAYLQKQGYQNFEITAISPLYCDSGIGTRNIASNVVYNKGMAGQYNQTVRLQMKTSPGEMKIYEVVLAKIN